MSVELLDAAASGMDAQRAALDVAARNVAAAEAAGPNADYPRLIPQFEGRSTPATAAFPASSSPARAPSPGTNVDILTEMIAVMNASRAYESDASIFDVGKTLAEKTIELERL